MRRVRPRMGGFREDPDWPLVAALEVFDEEPRRPVPPRSSTNGSSTHLMSAVVSTPPTKPSPSAWTRPARSPSTESLSCWAQTRPTPASSSANSSTTTPAAVGLSLRPSTCRAMSAKLAACRASEDPDGRFRRNATALERVLPRQLEPAEITARLGAPGFPAKTSSTSAARCSMPRWTSSTFPSSATGQPVCATAAVAAWLFPPSGARPAPMRSRRSTPR